jgi:hypothetical protein
VQRRRTQLPDESQAFPDPSNGTPWGEARQAIEAATTRLPPLPGSATRGVVPHLDAADRSERTALARELTGMADELSGVDPRSAARLSDLAEAVSSEAGRQRWADVDLRRAFQTERLANAYAVVREGGYVSGTISLADRVRNVLVLFPIFLTWFALAEASRAYSAYLVADPSVAGQSFLFLWEQGFGGHASPLAPSFSTVALVDAVLIGLIIVLTFYTHGRREAREDKIDNTAKLFQADLDNVLAEASVMLASDRGSRPERLAQSVERLADRFERNSHELLSRLRVEHERLEQMANRREREFADFGVFASGMRAGAEETHRLLVELRQISGGLTNALEDLTSEVSTTTDHQRTLLSAVQGLERLTTSNIQSDQAVTRQIGTAAATLADVAEKSIAGADAATQAARVATEAVRGIGEIAQHLAASQTRMETALASEVETTSRLADALRGSAGGVSASTRTLQEIGAGLSQLRDEFARLGSQSADQAMTLRSLLDDQAGIAGDLTKVARDVSSISIVTAQRQDAVNKEVSALVSRIEGLTNLLARATQAAPTAETLERAFANALRGEFGGQSGQASQASQGRPPGDSDGGQGRNFALNWPKPRS